MAFAFYVLLVAWMPIRELRLTLAGRSHADRWKLIGRQTIYAGSMVLALYLEGWLLERLFAALREAEALPEALRDVAHYGLEHLRPTVVLTPFAIVCVVMLSLGLIRLIMRWVAPGASAGGPSVAGTRPKGRPDRLRAAQSRATTGAAASPER